MFLGWRMVAVAFVADFVAVGFMFYSFGVFLGAVETDLGASRAEISWALALSNLVGSFAAPWIGRLLDRLGVRRVMATGACLVAAGFALASQARTLWQFHLVFGSLLAVGAMSMGNLSAAKLVASWFEERRGTALGVATMGISLSGLAMPPLATWLILNLGWRGGFLVYALGTLCVIAPLALFFVVERPEDVGQRPDGRPRPREGEPVPPPERTFRSAEILRDPGFWRIVLPFALAFFSNSAVLTHVVQHALSLGIADYRAAFLLSCIAGAGVAGKVAFGRIADGLGPRAAVTLSIGLQLAGVLLLRALEVYPALVATGLVFGFGMGGMVPLQGTLVATTFGRVSFGKAMGLIRPFQVPIHAAGVPFAGWVFVRTGGYGPAFAVFAAAYALALVALLAPRRGRGRGGAGRPTAGC